MTKLFADRREFRLVCNFARSSLKEYVRYDVRQLHATNMAAVPVVDRMTLLLPYVSTRFSIMSELANHYGTTFSAIKRFRIV